ncbi:hypothetical protein KAFR_0H00760 [Kazachstania africana CBS 2517]|uniref:Uncharacterized protein n=1 Tax=Kazachstania africana (strain ATCC 22294 / BCRC 22015 / CBS 2517 / CECT 1963 / NBRC 1671 / NRRL Y-8276) TaxID=1071382 RepID=H2AYS9_KAZAF|nr:hypothetical protein KAFR_0H00760 [Kazachstania africana CBS 2517]CCF59485.1 hypothetical protein KAFR_0H00760 [Kazachstania africana CBS 2517]
MSDQRPIRLAVLGGESTGKTSFVSRLTLNIVHEVHYPTRDQTNWLFDYKPHSKLAKTILDDQAHERLSRRTPGSQALEPIFKSPSVSANVLLSPLVFQSFMDNYTQVKTQFKTKSSPNYLLKNLEIKMSNDPVNNNSQSLAKYVKSTARSSSTDLGRKFEDNSSVNIPENYIPPSYQPIPIDIIDTSAFKPELVVPFLEVSLFRNLDKNILRGLADEPRRPVSTTSLLVASGASELNGKIDGYILVYSAIPEISHHALASPPSYNDNVNNTEVTPTDGGGFSILSKIRACILDAWTEFRNYQNGWEQGKEDDIYSILHNFKSIWRSPEAEAAKMNKVKNLRSYRTTLDSIDLDPSSPNSPPPCIIVCTHINEDLSSPLLVDMGRELATSWNCGFVGVNNIDDFNVDVAMSLIVKEIVEKDKLITKNRENANDGENSSNGVFRKIIKS